MKQIADGVFYAHQPVVRVTSGDLAVIRSAAEASPRKRARLCVHPDPQQLLHEMVIVLVAGGYVRPHRHLGRAESFHMMEGQADVVLFDDEGRIIEVIPMGPLDAGRVPFCRINCSRFHSVVVRGAYCTVHETTTGPFIPETTEFASWSPAESHPQVDDFLAVLLRDVGNFRG